MEEQTRQTSEKTDGELARTAALQSAEATAAFEELIRRHFNTVYAILYARLLQREDAEDAAQETFLRAYMRLGSLSNPDCFVPWLCRIARNLGSDWRARKWSAERLMPRVLSEETVTEMEDVRVKPADLSVDEKQQHDALARALERLRPDRREVVLLHYFEGLNPREIGERLGMHRTTVLYHLDRAVVEMREAFDPWLRQTVPRLVRPERPAARRAAAAVAVAMLMSEASRQALAASAFIGNVGTHFHASAGAAAGASTILANLMGLAQTGVLIVKAHKIAAAAVATGTLFGGGVYYQKQHAAVAPTTTPPGALEISAPGPGQMTLNLPPGAAFATPPGGSRIFMTSGSLSAVRIGGPEDIQKLLRNTAMQSSGTRIMVSQGPLSSALASLAGTARSHITGDLDLLRQQYSLQLGLDEADKPHAIARIESDLGVRITSQTLESDVLVLKAPHGPGVGLRTPARTEPAYYRQQLGRYTCRGCGLSGLVGAIKEATNYTVIDETGLRGEYDCDLTYDARNLDSIREALKTQLGLELVTEKRPMPWLEVTRRPQGR